MAIETVQEYQAQEKRLVEIKNLLEEMTQKDDVDLVEVVQLRDEAKELANALKEYLEKIFKPKS